MGLVADLDAALRKQFLNISKARRKPEIQPHPWRITSGGNLWRLQEIGLMGGSILAIRPYLETS